MYTAYINVSHAKPIIIVSMQSNIDLKSTVLVLSAYSNLEEPCRRFNQMLWSSSGRKWKLVRRAIHNIDLLSLRNHMCINM